ncbi:MarR family transcriptional regulator [Desertihabitans brevis]|uniref:MarR family transcriptional regulator n=1 Tax=Desertihabitans brevis TaxID=2268447 RepID=A0A367YYR7_9ACTN|nr:MarR family transcriptional regulator [Desertihabitans brevis]RCK70847.1 MarR family transcriptional regulator [Desertihabitans brevis]
MSTVDRAPASTRLAQDLRRSVMRLGRRLRQMHEENLGLTANQLSLLGVLVKLGPSTVGDLAEVEKVQPPAITRTVKALESLGLAERTADPEDGRRSVVATTERGRGIVLADRRRRDRWLVKRLAELSPEERRVLAEAAPVLLKLADA